MIDLRGAQLVDQIPLEWGITPAYLDPTGTDEYWNAGNLIRFKKPEQLDPFLRYLGQEATTHGAELAIGQAYDFRCDGCGKPLIFESKPPRLVTAANAIGMYHHVGLSTDTRAVKQRQFETNAHSWNKATIAALERMEPSRSRW